MSDGFERDLGQVQATVEMLAQNFDDFRQEIRSDLKQIKQSFDASDKRIGKLEKWRAYLLGIMAAIGFVFAFLMRAWK